MELMKKDDIDATLEAALMRTRLRQESELTLLLSNIKDLKNLMISSKSKKIYALKEVDEAIGEREPEDTPVRDLKSQLVGEIIELNHTKKNHNLVRSTMQEASLNVQMQQPVHEILQQLDVKTIAEKAPKVQNLLEYHTSSIHTSQSLIKVIEHKNRLDLEVLQSKLKYMSLLRDIMKKRQALERKDLTSHEDDEEVKAIKQKIESRHMKLKIMVYLIQGLISSSGTMWASEEYYLQVMMLCDVLLLKGMEGPVEKIIKAIEEARNSKEISVK